MTKKINAVILELAQNNNSSIADYYKKNNQFINQLQDFLDSTMDEVRLRRAVDFATTTLQLSNLADANIFRQAVLQRELFREVTYEKQRDHTAHTVNNWLLGWILYERIPGIKAKMDEAITNRTPNANVAETFGDIWINVSLLHDIGYIFEGSLNVDTITHNREYLNFALSHIHDYFNHDLWRELKISPPHLKKTLTEITKTNPTDFSSARSLSEIAENLRNLGDLRNLSTDLAIDLNKDAFELWKIHFKKFSTSNLEKIELIEKEFEKYFAKGIDGIGVRVLDHGVCSGLILLQYTTFYFRLFSAIKKVDKSTLRSSDEIKVIQTCEDEEKAHGSVDTKHWFNNIVWSTCAAATHNLIQQEKIMYSIGDDPLTYLGILVDTLQCWDRFSVRPLSVFTGELPIQSSQVEVEFKNDKATFHFNCSEEQLKKILSELDSCLEDWNLYIDIQHKDLSKT